VSHAHGLQRRGRGALRSESPEREPSSQTTRLDLSAEKRPGKNGAVSGESEESPTTPTRAASAEVAPGRLGWEGARRNGEPGEGAIPSSSCP
jgi:hypothetical protein